MLVGEVMKTGPERKDLQELVVKLEKVSKKAKSRIWLVLAERLSGSKRNRASINVGKLARVTQKGAVAIVPGKVLGAGSISHAVKVGAVSFSKDAVKKIKNAGGSCVSLSALADEAPKGTGVLWVE